MNSTDIHHGILAKMRYGVSLLLIYAATATFAMYIVRPGFIFNQPLHSPSIVLASELPKPPIQPPQVISGTPSRIIISRLGINLKVEEGNYDSVKHSWTLSAGNAHFATPSMPPNDYQGNTLIYGHNHDLVLGRLRNLSPGDVAKLVTENGTFVYTFTNSENVKPDDMTVFQYEGPPTLIIQTCTGSWNETRGLYSFKFERVER